MKFYKYLILILSFSSLKAQWSELGVFSNSNSAIGAIISDNSGNLFVTGAFKNSFGNYYIAKWTGNSWDEVGGLNALASTIGIAEMCFDNSGALLCGSNGKYRIAKWNGNNWLELGGTNSLTATDSPFTITCDKNNNVYVAGTYTNSTGSYYIAKWDGISWSELGGLNQSTFNNVIYSVCVDSAGNVYAGGRFTNNQGNYYVAKYDGTNWTELASSPNTFNNTINKIICDAKNNIYTTGHFTNSSWKRFIAKWDGNNWSEIGQTKKLNPNDLIRDFDIDKNGDVYAVGYFTNLLNNHYIAKYSKLTDSWSEFEVPIDYSFDRAFYSLHINSNDEIFLGGSAREIPRNGFVSKYTPKKVGLVELASNSSYLFPNPCTNQLNISSDLPIRTVQLFDLSGKSILNQTFDTQQNTYTIDVNHLAKGLYIAQLQSEKGKQFVKVLKE